MGLTSSSKRRGHEAERHPLTGVLAVIQPRRPGRGSLDATARDLVAARMAIAMRDDPPRALQLALMQAFQRGRKLSCS